jgi:hypothetical protein
MGAASSSCVCVVYATHFELIDRCGGCVCLSVKL